ncbi:MAG TPA: MFS transporter [Micromonosporaceae bacterium]
MIATWTEADRLRIQRRTMRLLFCTQIVAGVGNTSGVAIGALLAERIGGTAVAGFGQSAAVVGGALLAIPVTRLMRGYGRRAGLMLAYGFGAFGAMLVVTATVVHSLPLFFLGMLSFGGGTTANLQARYAAVDLAEPARRGRQLSIIVWATTIGAIAAPNLTSFADATVRPLGLPPLTGPFTFSFVLFLLTAVLVGALLRPDPLLTARALAGADAGASGRSDPVPPGRRDGGGLRDALAVVAARPAARLGVAAVAVGHLVMVGVMAMTPVHIGELHHGDVLTIVGVVLSAHIAGMYALAPVVGSLTDRLGRRPVILIGVALLLLGCAVAGTSGGGTVRLACGLALLGLGWSGTMVAGSTLLTESVPVPTRAAAQGLSDLVMGLVGAIAGALSGIVVDLSGYPTLALLAALTTVPLVGLALRSGGAGTGTTDPTPDVAPVGVAMAEGTTGAAD